MRFSLAFLISLSIAKEEEREGGRRERGRVWVGLVWLAWKVGRWVWLTDYGLSVGLVWFGLLGRFGRWEGGYRRGKRGVEDRGRTGEEIEVGK